MKFEIKYHSVKNECGLIPVFDNSETIDVNSISELDKYIENKKDKYGYEYKKEKYADFNYISSMGAIKVVEQIND